MAKAGGAWRALKLALGRDHASPRTHASIRMRAAVLLLLLGAAALAAGEGKEPKITTKV